MSRVARCLGPSVRKVVFAHTGSAASSGPVLPGVRRYGHSALKNRDEREYSRDYASAKPSRSRESRPTSQRDHAPRERAKDDELRVENEAEETLGSVAKREAEFQEYLNRLMSPLQFSPELAQRVLTHGSHHLARRGHNAGLSFIGRRVISSYLLLFLQSSPNLSTMDNTEEIASNALHTNLLGEHVGHAWGVGRAMVWQPSTRPEPRARGSIPSDSFRAAGLYKVQGETVQAIIGAIYQQYGATVAHRAFHTRLLPLIRVNGGLPQAFHQDVESICQRMGGSEGPLLLGDAETSKVEMLSN